MFRVYETVKFRKTKFRSTCPQACSKYNRRHAKIESTSIKNAFQNRCQQHSQMLIEACWCRSPRRRLDPFKIRQQSALEVPGVNILRRWLPQDSKSASRSFLESILAHFQSVLNSCWKSFKGSSLRRLLRSLFVNCWKFWNGFWNYFEGLFDVSPISFPICFPGLPGQAKGAKYKFAQPS